MTVKELLKTFKIKGSKLKDSKESAVTTGWGVNWSDDMIARDILQNFRDANKDNIGGIQITDLSGGAVKITGKSTFDLTQLYYLGSNKKDDDIGQYGEGFKASCVSIFNNHPSAQIVSVSGTQGLVISQGEENNNGHRPLKYDFYTVNKVPGSTLYIKNISASLVDSFKAGMGQFWREGHPSILSTIHSGEKFNIYKSKEKDGGIYYNGLLRAKIPNVPLLIVSKTLQKRIENKVAQDRDRKMFDGPVLSVLSTCLKDDLKWASDDITIIEILKAFKPLWAKGHPILEKICNNRYTSETHKINTYKSTEDGTNNFGKLFKNKYYSQLSRYDYYSIPDRLRDDVFSIQQEFSSSRMALPAYFTNFGVPNAWIEAMYREEVKMAKVKKQGVKKPTVKENNQIKLLVEAAMALSKTANASITLKAAKYHITDNEDILGQFKESRAYNSVDIYLHRNIFKSSFGLALSVLLHEHAHIFGYDGDRKFSDMLTAIIHDCLDNSRLIKAYKDKWNRLAKEQTKGTKRSNSNA